MSSNLVFFADTDCDIDFESAKKYDMHLIYMPVYLDGDEYVIDLEHNGEFKDFYVALNQKKHTTTAGISAQDYIDYWTPFLKDGKDIVYVAFSSGLSNTFAQMQVAIKELKEKFPQRTIYYADTKQICRGGCVVVLQAAELFKNGASGQEIVDFVNKKALQTETMFVVDDLNHLKRGGRISSTTAFFGGMLNIKPILRVDENGKLGSFAKGKGMKNSMNEMFNEFVKKFEPAPNAPVYVLHADSQDNVNYLYNKVKQFVDGRSEVVLSTIGPIVAAHCGVGTIGLCYNKK